MTWFGCKGPIRKHIVETDSWFENASQMVSFLDQLKKEKEYSNKEYYYLDQLDTTELRRKGRTEQEIKGCSFADVIPFFPDGHTFKKWQTIKDFMEHSGNVTMDDTLLIG